MSGSPSSRLEQIQNLARFVYELLETWYADEPSPDILTLHDFLYRFRLRENNSQTNPDHRESSPQAINAIKQAQRINRAVGNHRQIGLCEFHIALIYLHWGDCLGASQQFAEARRQWSFADETAGVCLTHFAEGRAYHHAYHYETAMACYGKTEQTVSRIPFTTPSEPLNRFIVTLSEALKAAQDELRKAMWKLEDLTPERPGDSREEQSTPAQHLTPQEEQPTRTHQTADSPAPLPFFNPAAQPEEQESPVPGHSKDNQEYIWYQVNQITNALFPKIPAGAWLLVQTRQEDSVVQPGGAIIVLVDREIKDGILVTPHRPNRPYQRIYLGKWDEPQNFIRPTSGHISLSPAVQHIPVPPTDILGIVKGVWLETAVSGWVSE